MPWRNLSDWWLSEVDSDDAYAIVVTPLLLDVLDPQPGLRYLDLGSGDGRVSATVEQTGSKVVGVDLNEDLVRRASQPSLVARLPALPAGSSTFDGAYAVLVLEHLEDIQPIFQETARVTKTGGVMAMVSNHPVWTAPNSTPFEDDDGEALWRPGAYFSDGTTDIAVEGGTVTFYHRSIGGLLNAAADAGWSLEKMIERPHHDLTTQVGIPRLLACRWRLLP